MSPFLSYNNNLILILIHNIIIISYQVPSSNLLSIVVIW